MAGKKSQRALDYEKLLGEERLILAATELIHELMKKGDFSRADLARAIGKTRGYVTQVLDGSRNMTLRTLAEIVFALGYTINIEARPRKISVASASIRSTGRPIPNKSAQKQSA